MPRGRSCRCARLLDQLDAQILCLARHHHRVRRSADQDLEVRRREGLGQVVPRAGPERLDAARDARVAGHDDDDRVLVGAQRGRRISRPEICDM